MLFAVAELLAQLVLNIVSIARALVSTQFQGQVAFQELKYYVITVPGTED